jgi:hypothetical protein
VQVDREEAPEEGGPLEVELPDGSSCQEAVKVK